MPLSKKAYRPGLDRHPVATFLGYSDLGNDFTILVLILNVM